MHSTHCITCAFKHQWLKGKLDAAPLWNTSHRTNSVLKLKHILLCMSNQTFPDQTWRSKRTDGHVCHSWAYFNQAESFFITVHLQGLWRELRDSTAVSESPINTSDNNKVALTFRTFQGTAVEDMKTVGEVTIDRQTDRQTAGPSIETLSDHILCFADQSLESGAAAEWTKVQQPLDEAPS